MRNNIIYWYNDGENIHWSNTEPNISYVIQKSSSIGIPHARAVQYIFKNKSYNYILTNWDMGNTSIIKNIMKGEIQ
jgi:hypothetical protein